MTRVGSRGLAAISALALLLSACGAGDGGSAVRDSSEGVIRAGSWSVYDLRSGDCIGDVSALAGDVTDIPLVPCDDPHTMEVFAAVLHPDGPYPGAGEVASFADRSCLTALTAELGLDINDGLAFSYLLPTAEGWQTNGDRAIICVLVFPDDAGITGSFVDGTANITAQ